jgi:hypothetical protein
MERCEKLSEEVKTRVNDFAGCLGSQGYPNTASLAYPLSLSFNFLSQVLIDKARLVGETSGSCWRWSWWICREGICFEKKDKAAMKSRPSIYKTKNLGFKERSEFF